MHATAADEIEEISWIVLSKKIKEKHFLFLKVPLVTNVFLKIINAPISEKNLKKQNRDNSRNFSGHLHPKFSAARRRRGL